MKKILIIGMLIVGSSFTAYSQNISQAKKQDIIKLIEITDAKAQSVQMLDLILSNLPVSVNPNVKTAIRSKFESKINEFVNMLIPVYDKHLSHDDIRKVIQFYESPVGQKIIKVTPLITQESFSVAEKWGQEFAQDIMQDIMRELMTPR